jgi:hypothetical protein
MDDVKKTLGNAAAVTILLVALMFAVGGPMLNWLADVLGAP